ncbi:hypothetical protein ABZY16_06805 [Streptomyces sp. NPDC006553]|uniref:hypothetical protein n=1 Tax=Streptomyces sp. NPDC006553 TaxID=3157180 RepID=UPI0033A71D34
MNDIEFDLPPKAPPEVIAERNAVADEVCRALAGAGLPVHRGDVGGGPLREPGADVHVDPLVEGGVYVDWRADTELRTTAADLFAKGIDYADPPPVVRHFENVQNSMQKALLGILASAGFQVEESDPFTHGSAVYVKGLRP